MFMATGKRPPETLPGARPATPDLATAAPTAPIWPMRDRIQQRLLAELNPGVTRSDTAEVRRVVERIFNETTAELGLPLSRLERNDIFDLVLADILGYGPLETLLHDDTMTEVLVNGPEHVFIERSGKLEETDVKFRDNDDVMRIVERIVAPLGRRVDESSPMVDARLPDGSRVNVIIPPISLVGPTISIRKFPKHALTPDELIKKGAFTPGIAEFLKACVTARLNVVVSGGTGTGKTTVLNALSSYIPEGDRIVTIEDAAELRLQQRHVVRLEARPPTWKARVISRIRQLVINALRMRPDRIVVGEVRGGEALDMLQAMNTGHDGSLTTVHSNNARDTLRRVETMVLMAGMDLPVAGHSRADRLGVRPDRASVAPGRWLAQDRPDLRSAGDGRRHHRHAGHFPVCADDGRKRQGAGLLYAHRRAPQVLRQTGECRPLYSTVNLYADRAGAIPAVRFYANALDG